MVTSTLNIENGAARLAGDLTFLTVAGLYEQMHSKTSDNEMPRSIDLADVGKIDSAGLALLLEWQSEFKKQSDSAELIEVRNPPSALIKIARLCDAGEYLSDNQESTEE